MIQKKDIRRTQRRSADAILAAPLKVHIGGDTLTMARPTIRTFIAASRAIAELPLADVQEGKEISCIISYARHSTPIGKIFATMLLGARKWESPLFRWRKRRLADKILDTYSPADLSTALGEVLMALEVRDFFVLTTSLNEVNLIKTEVVKTTASGR